MLLNGRRPHVVAFPIERRRWCQGLLLSIGLLAILSSLLAMASCGNTGSSPSSTTSSATAVQTAAATPTAGANTFSDGTYLVGTDMPAGTYKGTTTAGSGGYWQISSDANGSNIIQNNNVTGSFYVQVTKGQYLELTGVTITRVK